LELIPNLSNEERLPTFFSVVVDEFDASIHPKALMSIVNVFHNDDIKKMHSSSSIPIIRYF